MDQQAHEKLDTTRIETEWLILLCFFVIIVIITFILFSTCLAYTTKNIEKDTKGGYICAQ